MQAFIYRLNGRLAALGIILLTVGMIAGCSNDASSTGNVTATPTLSPGAGTYSSSQTVTISDTTSGAVLYCTTDGTAPTTSSPQCSQPMTVYKTEFMQVLAVAPGKSASSVTSAGYVINLNAAPTPTISPSGGTYTGTQQVTISDSLSGANIYYTLDGTTPTASSTLYTGAISIAQSETMSAIAVATGYANSAVASAAYIIQSAASTPTVSSLSPSSATINGAAFTLTINGTNFDSGATVKWGSTALTTTYVSSTKLTAAVPASLLATAGAVVVSVTTSAGTSAYGAFTVSQALPSVTALSPTSVTAGSSGFTLSAAGANFDSSAKVNWNEAALTTTYVSATSLTATVPASLVANAGAATVTVSTTAGTSNNFTFTINAASPTISALSPPSGTAGSTVTISGSHFGSTQGTVSIGGAAATVTSWTDSSISATVPSGLSTGSASLIVTTSGNLTASSTFTVNASGASISSINPSSGAVGTLVTISGSDFGTTKGTVSFGGTATTVTSWTDSSITATVPSGLSVGNANVVITTSDNKTASTSFIVMVALTGVVESGNGTGATALPLSASVQLYAAGTSGYGSAPTAIGNAASTNTTTGTFSIAYDCSSLSAPGDQMYLVATSNSSSDIVLMAALGSCSSIGTSYSSGVILNEATTIASAYALSPFASLKSSGGINIGTPTSGSSCNETSSWLSTGPETCNYVGLKNAFKTVNNLVNLANGTVYAQTPFYTSTYGNAAGSALNSSYVPQTRIHTLANILASCVQATGSCSTLTGSAGDGSAKDTLQVAWEIAQYPGTNVSSLYSLQASTPPYTTALSSAPNDWTLALTYTGGGLGYLSQINANPYYSPRVNSFAIDAQQNLWLYVNCYKPSKVQKLVEFNNVGEALSTASTSSSTTCGGYQPLYNGSTVGLTAANSNNYAIAFDQQGHLWAPSTIYTSSGSSIDTTTGIVEISTDGQTILAGANLADTATASTDTLECLPMSMAADASGYLWIGCKGVSRGGGIAAVNTSTATVAGSESKSAITNSAMGDLDSIALDPTGYVWGAINPYLYGYSNADYATFDTYLTQISASNVTSSTIPAVTSNHSSSGNTYTNVATDNAGNLYTSSATLGTLNFSTNQGTSWTPYTYPIPTSVGTSPVGLEQIVIDGKGHLWSMVWPQDGSVTLGAYSYLIEMSSGGALLSPSLSGSVYGYTGAGGGGETQPILANYANGFKPSSVAIDSAGNLWTTNLTLPSSGATGYSQSLIGQQLVEFVGIAAPVTTPVVNAYTNNAVGLRP